MTADSENQESPRPASPPLSGKDEAAALVRTIQMNAAEKARTSQEQEKKKPPSKALYLLLVLFAAANAYVWIAQPVWLVGNVSQLDTPVERDGVLRFRMYVQGQRIEAYRRENGVLPDRLEQTGAPFEGMSYQRVGPNSWELMGVLQDTRLLLRSTDSLSDFLASSPGAGNAPGP